jgi:septal ring factor EnvC (AmiA/AmiB activator)
MSERLATRGGWGCLLGVLLLGPVTLHAQQVSQAELERSKQRLEQIKQQRDSLERQSMRIQGQVTDVSARIRSLERQRDLTSQAVREIEQKIGSLGNRLESSSAALALAEDNLADKQAILRRRLADIYKRGPLYTFQVMLTAESFGDLLARYKYLYLTSRQDRSIVGEVTKLTERVRQERNALLGLRSEYDRTRGDREVELQNYARLAEERQSQLRQLERTSTQTKQRITALERSEAQLTATLAALEKARRAAAPARGASGAAAPDPESGGLSTSDIGKLDWPVDGTILYEFGRDSLPSGAVVRHNGIGIAAAVGTPVKAVDSGKVVLVQPMATYGLTVILQHGNGYYSLYTQLKAASVKVGQQLARGQVLGTVGGANLVEGPHLYFEIRGSNQIALDPIIWLRRRQ